ncbi:MAG TPA: 4-(cytidine 5'-diphospho)-2-C-methyl-D-erythritol kinase [Sporolactobacillaceae bacterium]|nr:4-(cytidine 5'-diphospho)-2-C-methyl-D-erythritol kinase [Sporolactobacillaceae bacterium]
MKKIIEKAPAKINLSLDVLRKRPDGYHDVNMVMTTVDLADHIECDELADNHIVVSSSALFVPEDQRNLAYKAAALIKERFGINKGVRIAINKQIPVSAGLAGGSSDAAATIRALNQMWELNLSLNEMMELGAMIGSDVAFCVHGGTAVATGRGELIKPLPAPPPCWVVLAKPPISVSTSDIYGSLDVNGITHPDVEGMVQAIHEGDYSGICARLGNALETVTMKNVPEVNQIKTIMGKLGADGVLMSGSGPTVFGLTKHESRVQRLFNGLKGFCVDVYAVRLLGGLP